MADETFGRFDRPRDPSLAEARRDVGRLVQEMRSLTPMLEALLLSTAVIFVAELGVCALSKFSMTNLSTACASHTSSFTG